MDTPSTFEKTERDHAWDKADLHQRLQLARRLEAEIRKIDAIRAELQLLASEVEGGP